MNKKILLSIATLLCTTNAFASNWVALDFPQEKSYYHSVTTKDTSGEVSLTFSCMKDINQKVITLDGVMIDNDKGSLKFYPSSKDTSSEIIEGRYKKNEDVLDVLIGKESKNILNYFKTLHEVNMDLKTDNETTFNFTFNLKGSSKNLNIFDFKCEKLNK